MKLYIGSVEETTTGVAEALESSKDLTACGLRSVTIMIHPIEGVIVSGEEILSMEMMDIMENGGLKSRMIDETMRQGSMLMNHYSTRNEKELFMSKLYNCNLPPFPIPFSELIQSSIPLMTAQFSKALKVEMCGSKAKTVEAPS